MKYVIVVTMFFFNPTLEGRPDGVVIHNADETPLMFNSLHKCLEHVHFNHTHLHNFALDFFEGEALVRQVLC